MKDHKKYCPSLCDTPNHWCGSHKKHDCTCPAPLSQTQTKAIKNNGTPHWSLGIPTSQIERECEHGYTFGNCMWKEYHTQRSECLYGGPCDHKYCKKVLGSQRSDLRERFRQIGAGSVRFTATRDEVLAFIESELAQESEKARQQGFLDAGGSIINTLDEIKKARTEERERLLAEIEDKIRREPRWKWGAPMSEMPEWFARLKNE